MILRLIVISVLVLFASVLSAAGGNDRSYGCENGLSSTIIGGAVQDGNGLLWFATWAGLHCYDGYDFHRISIEPGDSAAINSDRILDIMLSDDGNILCHTGGDVYEFDLSDFRFRDIPSSARDSILTLMGKTWKGLVDRQGNMWTADNVRLYKRGPMHHPASVIYGTAGLHPRSFLLDGNRLLIGIRADCSVVTIDADGSIADRQYLPGAPYVLFKSRGGNKWAGCKPGAFMRLDGKVISNDIVYDIKEDSRGRMWLATFGNGIRCCPEPDAEKPSLSEPFADGKVRQLLITKNDNVVAATTDGLLVGHITDDVSATTFRRIRRDGNNPASLASNSTMSLAQDSKGNIYIATESSGIDVIGEAALMGSDPQFRHLNTRTSSIAGDVVRAMALQADTLLMIVGNDNVSVYNPSNDTSVTLSRTFWNDTCRFGEATPIMLPDSSWVFGAEEGALRATYHNIYSRGYVPPIIFTTLAVNGSEERLCLVPGHEISLDSGSRNISVGFVAVDYVNNEDIYYRSRIDGSPWTPFSRSRTVTLFNMSPGRHVLEVQSTDRYGRYVHNSRSIVINVAPFWYETILARILFALALIILVAAVTYTFFHISALHRRQRELLAKYMSLIGEREADAGGRMADVVPARPEDSAFLDRVRRYIEDNISNPDASVEAMASAAAASRSTLNRRLRTQIGISASQLLVRARMKRARELMSEAAEKKYTMADIAAMCGYTDVYYFQRVLKKNGEN